MSANPRQERATINTSSAQSPSVYQPVFGVSDAKSTVPRWLPVSLRATAAAGRSLSTAAPPPRKAAISVPPPPRRTASGAPPPPRKASSSAIPPPRIATPTPPTASSPTLSTAGHEVRAAEDNFNGALYCAKAFGIATVLVSVGAGATVWGVKSALGVRNTQEFADRMRSFVLARMPMLSSRIHRALQAEDHSEEFVNSSAATTHLHGAPGSSNTLQWSWPEAEERLRVAYDSGGVYTWAEAVLHELETEGQVERVKRGHA
ncbi:predicted protein [Postia placenta Mad-698-R]|uniref:Uncharacterized protein n=1 Tax=Postia placenta MAD-698-R-SB12 TaxID=670580 RepID=A0A1X6N541_9APHY|nr:hypothetical protein POSPLADRAFT_1045946 [Postia placenta MAD-698-R-SB12]EED78505.1 predicted protein [Postia placenta Mad-698-R]OSX63728.1 hypothetical protein POSPLADRAFT_1045946 [Postia placenta MAD-698-R-SB12]